MRLIISSFFSLLIINVMILYTANSVFLDLPSNDDFALLSLAIKKSVLIISFISSFGALFFLGMFLLLFSSNNKDI
ncbi:hypothetical protein M2135_002848 [Parabacteroides sp. PF5-9]|nr:hypothetical protein [Parabacteroides sp. PF5-9]